MYFIVSNANTPAVVGEIQASKEKQRVIEFKEREGSVPDIDEGLQLLVEKENQKEQIQEGKESITEGNIQDLRTELESTRHKLMLLECLHAELSKQHAEQMNAAIAQLDTMRREPLREIATQFAKEVQHLKGVVKEKEGEVQHLDRIVGEKEAQISLIEK